MSMKPNGKSIISSSDDNSACFLRRQPRSYVFQRNIPGPSRSRSCSSLNGTVIQECGVSVPDDKRLFKLVSMSGALEELDICLEDVILRAAQMEQIVEKVCEERLNTGVSNISVYFFTSSFIFSKVGS
ncbi:unnamed protein product [Brassica napus]|uniref:(rape) hypothetical protein n=1 Tax=Brassica napus TaxID=3708 RepID=A0A816V3A1_BRANA|nr:unnamed protein product [Brassica napus]